MTQHSLVGQGLIIIEDSRSHSVLETTVDRTPLDEWSVRRRHLYLKTKNPHKRQTSMPPAIFEHKFPASEKTPDPRLRPRGHWDRLIYVLIF